MITPKEAPQPFGKEAGNRMTANSKQQNNLSKQNMLIHTHEQALPWPVVRLVSKAEISTSEWGGKYRCAMSVISWFGEIITFYSSHTHNITLYTPFL